MKLLVSEKEVSEYLIKWKEIQLTMKAIIIPPYLLNVYATVKHQACLFNIKGTDVNLLFVSAAPKWSKDLLHV